MNESAKLKVRRRTARRIERTPEEVAELRAVRERFQQEKPTLEQVLAITGQTEALPLGEYLRVQELLGALRRERERQQVTLGQLAERTGYDPAVLSRLLTGRQANTTLATVARIANALGKQIIHTLRDLPTPVRGKAGKPALRRKKAATSSVKTGQVKKGAKAVGNGSSVNAR